jgi:hypothetical protein
MKKDVKSKETKKKNVKSTSKKNGTTKKTAKKTSSTRKTKKKSDPNCNLWVRNSEGDMEQVSLKPEYRMQFVNKFGTLEIPLKDEFEAWYSTVYK